MYMDDLGHFGAAGDADASSPLGRILLYPLCSAAGKGRADIVQFMLDKGYFREVLTEKGCTPLQEAARAGSLSAVQVLLAAGADFTHRAHSGKSALDIAIAEGHVDIASAIVDDGADVNAFDFFGGETPLHHAAVRDSADALLFLLAKGADIDALDRVGHSPLHVASYHGKVSTTRVLLTAGADTSLEHGVRVSALSIAAAKGHVDVVIAHIEHGVDVNAADDLGLAALHIATISDRAAVIDALAEAGAKIDQESEEFGLTPFHIAVAQPSLAAAQALLKHGASVRMRTAADRTPLHLAAAYAGKIGIAQVVDHLLRHGADEKAITDNGLTPADVLGWKADEEDSVPEDVGRVRQLLANAPADRAWRRRCFLVLCRAYYPSGRVQLGQANSNVHDTGIAKRFRRRAVPSRAEAACAGVASMLMGVGADPISLMGDGADIIFKAIVEFL